MPKFRYTARTAEGETTGELISANRKRAIRKLQGQGLTILRLEEVKLGPKAKPSSSRYQKWAGLALMIFGLFLTGFTSFKSSHKPKIRERTLCKMAVTGALSPRQQELGTALIVSFPELPVTIERELPDVMAEDGSYRIDYQLRLFEAPTFCRVRLKMSGEKSREVERVAIDSSTLQAKVPSFSQ